MIQDPIADMLTRIKNGYMARKKTVLVPQSKFKFALAQTLKAYRFVGDISASDDRRTLTIHLMYPQGKPAVTQVVRMSKPGLRRYMSVIDLGGVRQGLGYLIISTPKGVMTHIQAKKERLGGEVICKIW